LLDNFSMLRKAKGHMPEKFLDGEMPPTFLERIKKIAGDAYDWNTTAKRDVLDYDLEPFVFPPQTQWVPTDMEPFEKTGGLKFDEKIISSVTLGLRASATLATGNLSNVQEKAKVLVEAYFPAPQTPGKAQPEGGGRKEEGKGEGGKTEMESAAGGGGGNGAHAS
jgi:hypothetical protein